MNKFGLVIISACAVILAGCSSVPFVPEPTTSVGSPSISSSTPTPSSSASITDTASPGNQDLQSLAVCGTLQDHRYEACAAYVFNDAYFSLEPYYRYVHSDSPLSGLKSRLALKYHDQALQTIQQRAANWPQGTNDVDADITILTAQSSLTCNRAVLTTRENWTVRDSSGTLLYQENGQLHTVVLRRIPDQRFAFGGFVLHQWVVYDLYDGVQNLSVC